MIKIRNSLLEGVTETKSIGKFKKLSDIDKADPSHPSQHPVSETELDRPVWGLLFSHSNQSNLKIARKSPRYYFLHFYPSDNNL